MMAAISRTLAVMAGLLLALAPLLAGCDRAPEPDFRLTEAPGQMPDLKVDLKEPGGKVRTAEGFRGKAVLMYFGYTHCPDICPMTLGRIKQALAMLPQEQAERVAVLFVTVDPERDTPEVMRRYVAGFNLPQLTGLMGEGEGFRTLKKRFHVFVELEKESQEDSDYAVSHSNQVLVFDPGGNLRLFARLSGKDPDSPEDLAADLGKLL